MQHRMTQLADAQATGALLPKFSDRHHLPSHLDRAYAVVVAETTAAGFGDLFQVRRTTAAWRFFHVRNTHGARRSMVGRVGRPKGLPVPYLPVRQPRFGLPPVWRREAGFNRQVRSTTMANHALGTPARTHSTPQNHATDLHAVSGALIDDALTALQCSRDQKTLQQSIAALTAAQDLLWLAEIQSTAESDAPTSIHAASYSPPQLTVNVFGDVGVLATGKTTIGKCPTPLIGHDAPAPASLIRSALRALEDGGNDAVIDSYNLRAMASRCLHALDTLPPAALNALAEALQAWRHQHVYLRQALHDVAEEMNRAIETSSNGRAA